MSTYHRNLRTRIFRHRVHTGRTLHCSICMYLYHPDNLPRCIFYISGKLYHRNHRDRVHSRYTVLFHSRYLHQYHYCNRRSYHILFHHRQFHHNEDSALRIYYIRLLHRDNHAAYYSRLHHNRYSNHRIYRIHHNLLTLCNRHQYILENSFHNTLCRNEDYHHNLHMCLTHNRLQYTCHNTRKSIRDTSRDMGTYHRNLRIRMYRHRVHTGRTLHCSICIYLYHSDNLLHRTNHSQDKLYRDNRHHRVHSRYTVLFHSRYLHQYHCCNRRSYRILFHHN